MSDETTDQDTEGQKFKPTEFASQRAVDDEDTEGQKMKPTEFASQRAVDDDEDTEGHSQKWGG